MEEIGQEEIQDVVEFLEKLELLGLGSRDFLRVGYMYALDVVRYAAYCSDLSDSRFYESYTRYPLIPHHRKQAIELLIQAKQAVWLKQNHGRIHG